MSSACASIANDLPDRAQAKRLYEKAPTRARDQATLGARGFLVFCYIFGEPRIQSRLPAVAERSRTDISPVHCHDPAMGSGWPNGWGAWSQALFAIEYHDP